MAVEIHKSFPVVEIFATTSAGSSTLLWGNIAGTLANQVDLQAALDAKAPSTPQFLTLATHSGIANERVFTPSADFTPTDGGAGSTYTLALATQGGLTPGTYNTFTVNNKGIITAASSVPSLSPITTRGDLIIGDSSGLAVRLPIGTATYVLTSDGTDVSWAAPSSSFTLVNGNGTTVNGTGDGVDLGGAQSGNISILDGSGTYSWSIQYPASFRIDTSSGETFNMSGGSGITLSASAGVNLISSNLSFTLGSDATGDTYYRNSSGYFTRLAAGTNGYVLTSQGSGSAPIWSSVGGSSAGINTEVQLSNGSGGFTAGGSTMASNVFSLGLTTNASVTQDITIKNSATTSHLRLLGRASGTSGIIGGQVSIISGAGNAAGVSHGGTINITGGNGGATTGNGGAINITSGSAVAGNYQGGLVSITGGLGNGTQSGGGVTITSGSSNGTGTGGTVSLIAGFGGATSGAGGNVNIYAGDANAGNSAGGSVVLRSGQSTGTQTAGSISLLAASSLGTTGAGGALYLYAGNGGSTSGAGGSIYFTAGNAAAGNSGGGIISLAGGRSSGTGIPGGINITGGDADTIHGGGDVLIAGGLGGNTSGAGGVVNIYGGNAAGGNSAGGAVTVLAGGAVGIGIGGLLNIIGGEGGDTSGAGGDVIIRGGPSLASTSASGAVTIGGGNTDSLTGEGGATTITTGNGGATSGNSGTLNISTGSIISGISGNININPNLLGVLNLSTTNTGAVNIGNATGIVTIGGVSVSLTATPATSASFSTATLLLRESGGGLTKVAASGGGTTNFLRADGTWAAPSGGGGITNGAANTELMMSNGTNAIASGIFVPSAGDLNLGTGVGGATRIVTAAGSATDIAMSFVSKGTGVVKINNVDFRLHTASALFPSNYILIGQDAFQLRSTGTLTIGAASATAAGQPPDVVIEGTGAGAGGSSTVGGTLKMFGGQSGITGIKSGDVIISGGQASVGNADGGDTYITYGVKAGSGKDGNVAFFTNSISNWQNMERGVFIADALTTPTGNPTNGNFHYIDATDSTPKWLDENGVTRKAWSAAEIIALLESEGYITNGQAESLSNQMN